MLASRLSHASCSGLTAQAAYARHTEALHARWTEQAGPSAASASCSQTSRMQQRVWNRRRQDRALTGVVATAKRLVFPESENKDSCPPQGCLEDLSVSDIMTSPAYSVSPDTDVFDAMDMLVNRNVSGMPVTDEEGLVVGVISGYDLLALDVTPGRLDSSVGLFPPVDRCTTFFEGNSRAMWNDFREMQDRLTRAKGTTVGEAMHDAATISEHESLMDAANLIVRKKLHRLIVVDDRGALVGVVSRGDIMRATINNVRFAMEVAEAAEAEANGDNQAANPQ